MSVDEHVIVRGNDQTHVANKSIAATVHKLQYILSQETLTTTALWLIIYPWN